MDFAFQNVVGYILRHSKLSISLIRITHVTEDTFHVSIEARTTNTGPASATLSAFTIDLCGPAGRFGQVHLPAITTHSDGAPIVVTDQLVRISDKAALQAFIKPVIVGGRAVLVLRDGHTAVRALGIGPKPICYEKDIPMPGMSGPRVRVRQATTTTNIEKDVSTNGNDDVSNTPLTITIDVANPSPMEISFGECEFEIRNASGAVFAVLRGELDTRCQRFEATFQGTADRGVAFPEGAGSARLVGRRCFGAGWCDETVKQIHTPLMGMRKVFEALGLPLGDEDDVEDKEKEEEEEEEEGGKNNGELAKGPSVTKKVVREEPARAPSKFWPGRFWRAQVS